MSIRGRAAENAVNAACAHYRKSGKGDIRKQATGMRKTASGWHHSKRAAVDFRGGLAGGRSISLEVKQHDGVSFPISESTLPMHQRNALDVADKMGGHVWVLIDLPDAGESYMLEWKTIRGFLDKPYRHSLSLQFMRAHGFVAKSTGRGTEDFAIYFLDYKKHDLHAGAYLAEAADRARSPIVDLDKPTEGNSERVVMTKEQRLAGVRNAIAAYRPKRKGLWGK